jgi:hypothetical protein
VHLRPGGAARIAPRLIPSVLGPHGNRALLAHRGSQRGETHAPPLAARRAAGPSPQMAPTTTPNHPGCPKDKRRSRQTNTKVSLTARNAACILCQRFYVRGDNIRIAVETGVNGMRRHTRPNSLAGSDRPETRLARSLLRGCPRPAATPPAGFALLSSRSAPPRRRTQPPDVLRGGPPPTPGVPFRQHSGPASRTHLSEAGSRPGGL